MDTTTTSTATSYTVGNRNWIQYGWVCPKCGTANAPWKSFCDCFNKTITCDDLNTTAVSQKQYKPYTTTDVSRTWANNMRYVNLEKN